ncbi:hypothetical protein CF70_020680 [Cupriavidus sp. SK-3]|uniref:hypothetical protein n=1 Tax=Cupriavidus sp. SK-3 TaxID=1470558 RepID=UPI0004489CFC|nr:hypothetical protein [Cupriavidus sp. SK-3]KDP84115.1 hypothetical protein CF70_020680 [Cupriavidus sp. SK-3]
MKIRLAVGTLAAISCLLGIDSLTSESSSEKENYPTSASLRRVITAPASSPQQGRIETTAPSHASLFEGAGLEGLRHHTDKITSDPALTPEQKFDFLWADFQDAGRRPIIAKFLLDTMRLLPLRATTERVSKIEDALYGSIHEQQVKRALVNLLASQYETNEALTLTEQSRLGVNPLVAATLAKAARSPDTEISHQAIIQYTRIGFFPDTLPILNAALSNGAISRAEYTRELGFLLPLIQEPEAQRLALHAITHSGVPGGHTAEDLATVVLLPYALSSLHSDTLSQIQKHLAENQPVFPDALATIDFLDLVRYSDWLSAIAAIEASLSGGSTIDRIATVVMQEGADPRGLLAVVASPAAEAVTRTLAQRGQTAAAQQKLALLSLEVPNDVAMARMIREAQDIIGRRPP